MSKELLELLTDTGEPTGEYLPRDLIHSTGQWHYSVHVWLLDGDRVLLQKRADDKESYPGMYDVSASGHVSAGEYPLLGAVRETEEEIGLTVIESEFIPVTVRKLCYNDGRGFVSNEFNYVYILPLAGRGEQLRPQESEISELRWATLEELGAMTDTPACCIESGELRAVEDHLMGHSPLNIKEEPKMQRVYDFLKKAGTYYLATTEDGKPRVRPFGTIDLFEGKLYIQTGLSKPVAKQMLASPDIEISAMSEGKWIRVAAKAVHDDRIEAQQHMLDNYPDLQSMYKAGDGNTAVFALTEGKAVICSFTEPPVEIEF